MHSAVTPRQQRIHIWLNDDDDDEQRQRELLSIDPNALSPPPPPPPSPLPTPSPPSSSSFNPLTSQALTTESSPPLHSRRRPPNSPSQPPAHYHYHVSFSGVDEVPGIGMAAGREGEGSTSRARSAALSADQAAAKFDSKFAPSASRK